MPNRYHPKPLFERFVEKVRVDDGCWMWTGCTAGRGTTSYGKITVTGNIRVGAHRASWMLFRGPIPEGLWVLHHCDTPGCVKPSHLYLGTQADNMRDMSQRERHSGPLRRDIIRDIRLLYETGAYSQRKLAAEYCVGQSSISRYIRGERGV